jgi:hypothetical protein
MQQCIDAHPEFADRLRNLLPTIEVLVDLDRSESVSQHPV